jgi:four helix bundle protein
MNDQEVKKKDIKHFRDLDVYQRAFASGMKIFKLTKSFPVEEKYSLTDQIRKASRSVCANLAEAWRKRKYIAVFKNKLTDAMQEASETQSWLEFSLRCEYIGEEEFNELDSKYEQILSKLNSMDKNANKFCF